ncbi:MAG: 16S rRNA (uracil(1498)-N(3))-methyltransferase [Chitinispirillales bacterium]|nr:16S rRNA (uracil(1498)-N(3))-methyltransferase [Chitinispirillales bacterium]
MRESEHHLFYSGNIADGAILLDNGEANHAVSVLRVKLNQQLQITDGKGVIYDCECSDILKQSVLCKIINKTQTPKIIPELTLLAGLPDKEHFETILEYATALGVSRVVPLLMDHCRKPWWGSWEKAYPRLVSKMIVSMKQCLYPYIPQLDAPVPLDNALGEIDAHSGTLIIADQSGRKLVDADIPQHKKISCLVGPPGGASASELKTLESRASAQPALIVKIAPTRLRTELAATLLCSRVIAARL